MEQKSLKRQKMESDGKIESEEGWNPKVMTSSRQVVRLFTSRPIYECCHCGQQHLSRPRGHPCTGDMPAQFSFEMFVNGRIQYWLYKYVWVCSKCPDGVAWSDRKSNQERMRQHAEIEHSKLIVRV